MLSTPVAATAISFSLGSWDKSGSRSGSLLQIAIVASRKPLYNLASLRFAVFDPLMVKPRSSELSFDGVALEEDDSFNFHVTLPIFVKSGPGPTFKIPEFVQGGENFPVPPRLRCFGLYPLI